MPTPSTPLQREALCPTCNGLQLLSVGPVDKDTARDFGKLAAAGSAIRTVPLTREMPLWCQGHKAPKRTKAAPPQPSLFA